LSLHQQAAEKDPYVSLVNPLASAYCRCAPPLVDFSRASPLDLFEQPARGFFSATCQQFKYRRARR
jgi:hypothetical protein